MHTSPRSTFALVTRVSILMLILDMDRLLLKPNGDVKWERKKGVGGWRGGGLFPSDVRTGFTQWALKTVMQDVKQENRESSG